MSRTLLTAAFAALMAASPAALAETAGTAPADHGGVTTNRIEPGQIRATDLKGSTVYDGQNNNIGSIKDLVLARSGRVAAVVIDVDGKNVAVPMRDLRFAMDSNDNLKKVTIDRGKNELKSAQAFDLDNTGNARSGSSAPPLHNR